MTRALIFPGQGSQAVGMGRDLYERFAPAKAVFDEVDDVLAPLYGHKLTDVIFNGPIDKLTQTIYTQPALMAMSIAVYRTLIAVDPAFKENISYMAGHSLGEYSALCAAGVLSLKDTAYLLYHRGKAMSECTQTLGDGAPMAAIMGLDVEVIERITKETHTHIANDNGGGQMVVSGSPASILKAIDLAKSTGAKRALPLNVSAPFHCPLMKDAEAVMREKVEEVTFNAPEFTIVCNVTAKDHHDAGELKQNLIKQVCGRVRWRESVTWMAENGVDTYMEIGAGKVLTGLCKRIVPDLKAFSVGRVDDVESLTPQEENILAHVG